MTDPTHPSATADGTDFLEYIDEAILDLPRQMMGWNSRTEHGILRADRNARFTSPSLGTRSGQGRLRRNEFSSVVEEYRATADRTAECPVQ